MTQDRCLIQKPIHTARGDPTNRLWLGHSLILKTKHEQTSCVRRCGAAPQAHVSLSKSDRRPCSDVHEVSWVALRRYKVAPNIFRVTSIVPTMSQKKISLTVMVLRIRQIIALIGRGLRALPYLK